MHWTQKPASPDEGTVITDIISKSKLGETNMSAKTNEMVILVNDCLNLLRGKSVRFILEDGDLRMIANLVEIVDQQKLVYDPVGMVYREPLPEKKKVGRPRKEK